VIGSTISLGEGEEEDQGVYPRESRKWSEEACKLGKNSLIYLILLID